MSQFIVIGTLLAMLSVAFGAMGAHALKDVLEPQALNVFQTASTYQMYHALAMILTALSIPHTKNIRMLNISGWFFLSGIILFSGSLYGLSLFGIKSLGMLTPVGGICFIIAWLIFSASFIVKSNKGLD